MGASGKAGWPCLPWSRAVIFLTVGSQMPFDRLVQAVDTWAAQSGEQVLAQIGDSSLQPSHLRFCSSLEPAEFRGACLDAEFIIGHAGMGTVLTALDLARPLVVMPRRGNLHETRNDHQLATARWLTTRPGIVVAWDERELPNCLAQIRQLASDLRDKPPCAAPGLISGLRRFIGDGRFPE